MGENILEGNPATVPLWVAGMLRLFFARAARRPRTVGAMSVATWVILVVHKSKLPQPRGSSFRTG